MTTPLHDPPTRALSRPHCASSARLALAASLASLCTALPDPARAADSKTPPEPPPSAPPPCTEPEGAQASGECANDSGKEDDDEPEWRWKIPERHGFTVLGGFGTPRSTFGTEGGVVVGSQSYGGRRSYAVSASQVEIGNGLGAMLQGFRTWNALELKSLVSPILGVNPLELDLDLNTNSRSHDYLSWTVHADAGVRVGPERSCFAAGTTGIGLSSGSQSLGSGGWFRTETNLHASGVCGPVALGISLRNIDDPRGTVAQALATVAVFVDPRRRFGFGAALAVTGYAEGGPYASVYEAPLAAFDRDVRQTLLRITFVYRDAETRRRKWRPAPDRHDDDGERAPPLAPPPLPVERASLDGGTVPSTQGAPGAPSFTARGGAPDLR